MYEFIAFPTFWVTFATFWVTFSTFALRDLDRGFAWGGGGESI